MISVCDGVVYVERCSLASLKHIRQAKKAIRKCFQVQVDRLGFSLVELLSPCPTNWKLSPAEAWEWVNNVMVKTYPLECSKTPRDTRIRNDYSNDFAGFGGQGVLLMGYILSHGAMLKGLNVTYFPSYGAEMRGARPTAP